MKQVLSDPLPRPSLRCDVAGAKPDRAETSNVAGLKGLAGLFVGTVVNVEVDCQTALGQPLQRLVR